MFSLNRHRPLSRSCIPAVATAALLLALPAACAAATPSKASLNGTYVFQHTLTHQIGWSKSITCHYGSVAKTFTGGGSIVDTEIDYGTLTFNGAGALTLVQTSVHEFNQDESDATVSIACPATVNGQPTVNNGHAVFDQPQPQTVPAAYTVESTGMGTISVQGQEAAILLLSAFNTAGVSTTVLFYDNPATNNDLGTGIGILK
jgi:hypothetical protein